MDLAPSGRVYKTTPAQRAKAAAWRKANPEKSLAYGRAQTIRIRDSFVGPRRPRGRQRTEGPSTAQRADAARIAQQRRTPAERSESARKGQQTRATAFVGPPTPAAIKAQKKLAYHREIRAAFQQSFVGPRRPPGRPATDALDRAVAFVGPPTPEAIQTAQRRAKIAERQRAKTTRFKAQFVGPPKPPKVHKAPTPRPTRVVVPKVSKSPKVRPVRVDRAGHAWDRQSVTLVRRASKVVLRPPKAPRKPRTSLGLASPRIDPPAIFGPPAPPRAILRDTMRQEVAQAKAQAAADKVAAKELAVAARIAARAEAKAIEKAKKTWDRESIKLIRKTARFIREQVREAAQIAAKSRTPEQIAASKAAYEAVMASWDAEQRRIADETRNAFRRRVDAEQSRMATLGIPGSSATPTDPATAALVAAMRTPVRRVPFIR